MKLIKKAETTSMTILSSRKVNIKPFIILSVFNFYFRTTKLPRSIVQTNLKKQLSTLFKNGYYRRTTIQIRTTEHPSTRIL